MGSQTFIPREYDVFAGLDVDKKSIAATFSSHQGFIRSLSIPYKLEALLNHVRNHFADQKVAFAYEAGPTGYGLYDGLAAQGYTCLIAAPSMIPRAPGQRVKTNRLDSKALSESLRGGQLKSIHVPSPIYRELRHLTQLRDTMMSEAVAMKQRIKSLLLFEGIAFPPAPAGSQWSFIVKAKLRKLPCSSTVRFKLDQLLDSLEFAEKQVFKSTKEIRRFCQTDPELSQCIERSRSIGNLKSAQWGGKKQMSKPSWMKNIVKVVGVVVGLFAGCIVASAQQPVKTWKIGVLVSSTQALNTARDEALRQGLRDLGYEEGKNIAMEYRYAEGKTDRLDKLARELVEQKVDVIVVGGTAVAVAAKNATSTIPIVVAGAGDLVEAGLIKSFMYPGGNVTGVARMSSDFFGARLKLIKEILPKTAQVTALSNPKNPGHGRSLKDAELGARAMGLTFQSVTAQNANELDSAVGTAAKSGNSALFVMTDALFNTHLARIAQASVKNRLPSVYDRTGFVEAGGLVSYGVNLPDLSRRAAEYVDQIFKGAKPGDLTLVQPTKFDLALNLKTANQIGVIIPPEVLNRAVKVIK